MHPDPLFRVVPDGRFEEVRAQHGLAQDGFFLRKVPEGFDRRKEPGRMMDPVLSPEGERRNDGDPKSVGESGKTRVGEGRTAEEGDEGAVVLARALVDDDVDDLPPAQGAEDRLGSLVGENGGASAELQAVVEDELVDRRGLDRPDESVDRDRRVDADPPHDQFPVADMAGKDDHSFAGFKLCGDMLESAPSVFEQLPDLVVGEDGEPCELDADPPEVPEDGSGEGPGAFSRRKRERASGEIVPHEAPLRRAEGQEEIPCPVSDPERRPGRKKAEEPDEGLQQASEDPVSGREGAGRWRPSRHDP